MTPAPSPARSEPPPPATIRPRVLVVERDPLLFTLVEEWLSGDGFEAVCGSSDAARDGSRFDIVLVDLPHSRQAGIDLIDQLKTRHRGARIVALSSNLFAGVACCGVVARSFGADCVVPRPSTRALLLEAIRRLVPAQAAMS